MALTLNDVLTLGKMGFTKTDIAALMGAQPSTPVQTTPAPVVPQSKPTISPQAAPVTVPVTQTAPVTVPVTQTAPVTVPVTQTNAPAAPDYGALVAGLANLSEKINALSVPSAGFVGNPAPVTSVEDIILGAYQPKQADAPAPDFMKGVNK